MTRVDELADVPTPKFRRPKYALSGSRPGRPTTIHPSASRLIVCSVIPGDKLDVRATVSAADLFWRMRNKGKTFLPIAAFEAVPDHFLKAAGLPFTPCVIPLAEAPWALRAPICSHAQMACYAHINKHLDPAARSELLRSVLGFYDRRFGTVRSSSSSSSSG